MLKGIEKLGSVPFVFLQGDVQGMYDTIDKESFSQTDRQVSLTKGLLRGVW